MTVPTYPRARLADNRDISRLAYWLASRLRSRIAAEVERRTDYIQSNRLDPAFCLPAANWKLDTAANDYATAYRHLRDGGYAAANRLRFYCQFFTGYSVMAL